MMFLSFATIFLAIHLAAAPVAAVNQDSTCEADIFPVSAALEPRIKFWNYIFGELESDYYLLHDLHYPEITYYTVKFPRFENETPQETWQRAKQFGDFHKKRLKTILAAYNNGQPEALKELPPAAQENILKLQQLYPVQMATAQERVGIQHGVADKFKEAVTSCQEKYRQNIEAILTREKVPTELYWLVFVESMCTPYSGSHAGAAGIWQLMPGAARDFNLTVSKQQDDRFNVEKSTRAAARLLKRGAKKLSSSWPLVITAYNHGDSGVKRLTEKYQSTDLGYLIDNIDYQQESNFGFASMNFYAEFITVQRLGKQLLQHNEVSHDQNQ